MMSIARLWVKTQGLFSFSQLFLNEMAQFMLGIFRRLDSTDKLPYPNL
ncbi:MAG: hypothetical protein NTX45_04900 [Proteobacteria bacterium]|nr:hypothetical protein [Pseudomonadota bacterium]